MGDFEGVGAGDLMTLEECATEIGRQADRIKDLEGFIVEVRDQILYPVAHTTTELGRTAEGLGQITAHLLNKG